MAKRLALLIGNTKFSEAETFPALRTPANDVQDLATMLRKHGEFEVVGSLIDRDSDAIKEAIEEFYNQAERGALVLLYYSGHGYRDQARRLYLAAKNTHSGRLLSTGIREQFIHDAMSYSRSRHKIIVLDCCFSGAFIKGVKSGTEPLLLDKLKGEATAILASSGTIQYSFEEEGRNSLFTHYLIEGIATGRADEDKNGVISLDELFGYVDPKVRERRPEQTPMIEISSRGSEVFIAKNPNPVSKLVGLPRELQETIRDPRTWVREGAVRELDRLLHGSHLRLAQAAHKALLRLKDDDSRRVSSAAINSLDRYAAQQNLGEDIRDVQPSTYSSFRNTFLTSIRRWWRLPTFLLVLIAFWMGITADPRDTGLFFLFIGAVFALVAIEHLVNLRWLRGILSMFSVGFWFALGIDPYCCGSEITNGLLLLSLLLSPVVAFWTVLDAIRNVGSE